jgi:hypothetical protein
MNKRTELIQKAVRRGKYSALYHFLLDRDGGQIEMTFRELERILGFTLPNSAYLYRPWWANQGKSGHSQAMAWDAAGWKTALVDLDAETLRFERTGNTTKSKGDSSMLISDNSPTEYWVYENWTHKRAIIHEAECSFCNYGEGMHGKSSNRNGCWHGPIPSLEIAEQKANATGQEEVRRCQICV